MDTSGKLAVLSVMNFLEAWNGVILVGVPSEKSQEPELHRHRLDERNAIILRVALGIAVVVLGVGGIVGYSGSEWLRYVIALLSGCGVYISYLLLQRDLDIPNRVADRICGIIKENSCDEILQSKGAELFGMLHLSEIGAAFFFANLLALLDIPVEWNVIFAISLCALLFTFWSVWYQIFRVHAWQPLPQFKP